MVGDEEKEKEAVELGLTSKPPELQMAEGMETYRRKTQDSVSVLPTDTAEKDKLAVETGVTSVPPEEEMAEGFGDVDPIATIITEIADVGAHLKEGAEEAKLEGDNVTAGIRASAYMATQIGIGLIEGYTFFIRPHKVVQTGQAIIKGVTDVVTSPDPIKVVAKGVASTGAVLASDPVAFVGRTTGSIMGGIAAGKTFNRIRGPKTVPYEPPVDTDIQDFLVPEDIYPHEVVLSTDDMTLIPESTVIISDLGGDFLESHIVPRGKWPSSRIKGYRQTGADLIQELIPEGVGEPTTIYHPMSVPYPIFEHTPGIDLNVGKIVLPRGLKTPLALGTITGIASIEQPTVEPPDLAIARETQELIDAGLKQAVSITSVTKHKGTQTPKVKPQIMPDIIVKPVVPPYTIPDIIPDLIQEPTLDISLISLTRTKIIQKPVLETKVETTHTQQDLITFSEYNYLLQDMGDPLSPRIGPSPRRRRRRTRQPPDLLGWEPRKYPVKSAEEMLFGSSQGKRKAKPKKKQRKTRKRSEIRLV